MATKTSIPTVPSKANLDQVIDLKGKTFLVRLPDGTVVSGTGTYTARHTGEHVFVIEGKEHAVEVAGK